MASPSTPRPYANRFLAVTVLAFGLSGCAAMTQAVTDRGIMSDDLRSEGNWNKLKSMTGDRRLVRVVRVANDANGKPLDDGSYIICGEPFAGAIIARGASSGLTVTQYGSATDAVSQTAEAVDQRSDIVRFYEDAKFDWCMARASGDVNRTDYIHHLKELQLKALEALKKPLAAEDTEKDEKKEAKGTAGKK